MTLKTCIWLDHLVFWSDSRRLHVSVQTCVLATIFRLPRLSISQSAPSITWVVECRMTPRILALPLTFSIPGVFLQLPFSTPPSGHSRALSSLSSESLRKWRLPLTDFYSWPFMICHSSFLCFVCLKFCLSSSMFIVFWDAWWNIFWLNWEHSGFFVKIFK